MRLSRDSRSDVIKFWRDVEIFEPQRIPRPNRKQDVYDVEEGKPLPWEGDEPMRRRRLKKGERWRYTVYCGVFPLDATLDALKRFCAVDEDAYDARVRGEAALAGFELDQDGRLIPSSAVLSSSAWGLGKVHQLRGIRAGWSDGFPDAQLAFTSMFDLIFEQRRMRERLSRQLLGRLSEFLLGFDGSEVFNAVKEQVAELLAPDEAADTEPDTRTPPFDYALLDQVRTMLLDLTGTTGVLPQSHPAIRIGCRAVNVRNDEDGPTTRSDFLNSYIAEDLSEISRHVQAGRFGGALGEYLREADGADRIDVREDLAAVYEATRPSRIPLGRWPSPPEHSLALGQQLAVNNAVSGASAEGEVTGVNGPPGTGKTTLLRDMFAGLITERACKIAGLARPADGFIGVHEFNNNDRRYSVPQLHPDLCGFEIAVASSNNGAVQNVTAETPHLDEIDERWRGEIDYFTEVGQLVLNAARVYASEDEWEPAWSLMAAVLGNSENRGNFATAFWFGLKESKGRSVARPGMLEHLKTCVPERTWAQARAGFAAAKAKVTKMAAERERHYTEWKTLGKWEAGAATAQAADAGARRIAEKARAEVAAISESHDKAVAGLDRARLVRDEWNAERPNWFLALLRGGGEFREWRNRARANVTAANEAWDRLREIETELDAAKAVAAGADTALAAAEASMRQANAAYRQRLAATERARERFGPAYPVLDEDRRARELNAPWCDEEFNTARSELFLEALRLHRAFIEHNRDQFKRGLSVSVDVVKRKVPDDLAHETLLAAWQLLFMTVPVVSTTFASAARQFAGLTQGDLGWLFIDEAGQATPQAAVGAIWRSKHVMAVGDPLQLEPVFTLPHTIQQSLREHYGISECWVPSWTSVQGLADANTTFGTSLPGPDQEPLWVGSPLTVHRRCDDPMFTISNRIAYDGLMINDTPERDELVLPRTGATVWRSMWLQRPPGGSQGHWIPSEGERLDKLLGTLREGGFDMGEVMVVTPFKEVEAELLKRRRFGIRSAGTVHTAQGKQADIVILVLGGDPAKPQAGSFFARNPNFVNVAVSRAKRRLFVIGDRPTWSKMPYFSELASALGDPK